MSSSDDDTLIYPAHDYKGEMVSTIGEEKKFNPRLQVSSPQEYARIMNNLNLGNPEMMDIAVPTNTAHGMSMEQQKRLNGLSVSEVKELINQKDTRLIDLREESEILKEPSIKGSVNIDYNHLPNYLKNNKKELLSLNLIYYCAVGQRSALAVQLSKSYDLSNTKHLIGGVRKWNEQ